MVCVKRPAAACAKSAPAVKAAKSTQAAKTTQAVKAEVANEALAPHAEADPAASSVALASQHVVAPVRKTKEKSESAKARADTVTYLRRMSDGFYRKATDVDKEQSQEALQIYDELSDKDKESFAMAFKANPKNLGWVKQYKEKRMSNKRTTETVSQKYRTRI